MENPTDSARSVWHDGTDALEVMRRLTGRPVLQDRQWSDAVLAELSRQLDDPRIVRRDPQERPLPGAPGVLIPGARWHVNLSAIRGRWPELALAVLATVTTRDPLVAAGALVSLRHTLTQLSDDEAEVAATLVRLAEERGGSIPRADLEAAFAYDPARDGEMPPGIHPIDAPAVIGVLLQRGVLAEKAGSLSVQL
ncbi:hypothetical protein ACLQ2Q_20015 [Microbacterium sp. DT81.1]|uniref:hypothetical protein n=1 Tax=Microbacterium sp. DT81.1 TaxID=3393413 RepID=UPI003CE97AE8